MIAAALSMLLSLIALVALMLILEPRLPRVSKDWRSQLRAPLPGIVAGLTPYRIEQLPNGRAFYFPLSLKSRREVWAERFAYFADFGVVRRVAGAAVGDNGLLVRTQLVVFQVSLTPASVATIVAAEQALTVTGVRSDDILVTAHNSVAPATAVGGADARVAAANTINKIYINPTAGALVPTPGTYNVVVLRG